MAIRFFTNRNCSSNFSFMKTILLIDDHQGIRENICELLSLEGYHVICAENGSLGLLFAQQTKPDLILCDVRMPSMNGFEVLKALKEDSGISHIPLMFLSAAYEDMEEKYGISMGAKGFILKPLEENDLLKLASAVSARA